MRRERSRAAALALVALLLSAGATFALYRAGPVTLAVGLFVALALVFWGLLQLLRAMVLARRVNLWRSPGAYRRLRGGGEPHPDEGSGGPGGAGTREPRRPRPPPRPPRAVAIEPDGEPT